MKKAFLKTVSIASGLLFGMNMLTVMASDGAVTVEGVPRTTETLRVLHDLGEGVSYRWQLSENGGAFSDIPGAVGNTLYIDNSIAPRSVSADKQLYGGAAVSRSVRAVVSDGETEYISEAAELEKALGPTLRIEDLANKLRLPVRQETTPKHYIFKTDSDSGSEFILLDSDEEGYFVLAKDFYGTHAYDTSGKQKFDPDNPQNIAYWLNNEFLENGNGGKELPQDIIDNIDFNHRWRTEAGPNRDFNQGVLSDIPNDYAVNTGVVLLSQTELMEYSDKIGILDGQAWGGASGWSLRTVRGLNGQETSTNLCVAFSRAYHTLPELMTSEFLVRPAFYLKHDFFKKVKIDLDSLEAGDGGETNAALSELIAVGKDKLAETGLYTDEEINLIFGQYEKPTIAGLPKIIYDHMEIGEKLNVSYEFKPADDAQNGSGGFTDKSLIQWQTSSDGTSWQNWSSDRTVKVTNSQGGQYIRCVVTPRDGRPGTLGVPVEGEAIGPFPKALGPAAAGKVAVNSAENTPSRYVFRLMESGTVTKEDSEKEFILLDCKEGENGGFFVVTKDFYGSYIHSNGGDRSKFDPGNPTHIAYMLNHDFLEGKNSKKLPESVTAAIKTDHRWTTESENGAAADSAVGTDYTVECPIALLSVSELAAYGEKIGWKDNLEVSDSKYFGWWTRSAPRMFADANSAGTVSVFPTADSMADVKLGLRPAFYLDKSFFINTKLDWENTGEAVKNAIASAYTKEELLSSGIYTEEELDNILGMNKISIVVSSLTNGSIPLTAENIGEAELVSAQVKVTSSKTENISGAILMITVYNKDGALVGVRAANLADIPANGEIQRSLTVTNLIKGEAHHVQISVFGGIESLTPLTGSVNYFE